MVFSDKFIKANDKLCGFDSFEPAPYFRKKFELDFKPQRAEITICGLGFYELYINGKNITKGELAPYISNPDHICYYDNYNIAELLEKGENVIGIILGNGFRNCYGGFIWDFDKAECRGPVTVALCLEAEAEGNCFMLEADETFKTKASPILYNDIRMGYCYDSRLESDGWNLVDYDDSDWQYAVSEKSPKGIKKLCEAEPVIVTEKLKAVDVKHYDSLPFAYDNIEGGEYADDFQQPLESTQRENVYVYDFGKSVAGKTQIKINGKPGQKIVVRHSDNTVQGKFSINATIFYRKNDIRTLNYLEYGQVDTFICRGGQEIFTPKFKYDGFRYAYVEGLDEEQATSDAVICLVTNSDIKERGGFKCSNEVINKLQQCTRNSDLSNLVYIPTDNPQREKNGWTGDAWISAEHMLLNLTAEKTLREWLRNVNAAQRETGELPSIVPDGDWGYTGEACGSGPLWDCVCVQMPYYLYKYTGDKTVIFENASMIMKFLQYYYKNRSEDGLVYRGLGDWRDPFSTPKNNWRASSPNRVTITIGLFDAVKKAAFLFEQIELDAERNYAEKFAEELRVAIRENLIDFDTMTIEGDCQTSQTIGIVMGLFDEGELDAAQKRLIDIVHRDGDINAAGHYGMRHIYHLLCKIGEGDLAYKMVTSTAPSCYGYWIQEGATNLWESFRNPYSRRCDSRNQHFMGDISSWFIQDIAGIKPNPTSDDVSRFEISPFFVNELEFAEGFYDSQFGRISVRWERLNNSLRMYVEVPEGMIGEIKLPLSYCFESGNNECILNGGQKIVKEVFSICL